MNVLVADASVLAPVVSDGGVDGKRFRHRLRGEQLACPDLAHAEVLSVLRRLVLNETLSLDRANAAVRALNALPVVVYPVKPLLNRCWQLRDDVTAYDACYVALAEALGCVLVTADVRLANAPGPACAIEVL